MQNILKKATGAAVIGGSLAFTAGLGLASAAPVQVQDGLVNVALGNITVLEDVQVGVAAQVAALICGVPVTAAVLGSIDEGVQNDATCTSAQGDQPITFTQNAPGQSERSQRG